jgi:3-oxoadipate enol-lactonase
VRIHYRLDGPTDAPPLVLSNSLGTTLEVWSQNVPRWASSFRLLRYDHRGHGGSALPSEAFGVDDLGRDVVRLLDLVQIERASFCGLSLGGAVGQWLAVNQPERIDRLVLACTSTRFGEPDHWLERARRVRAAGLAPIADSVVGRWFTPQMFDRDPATIEAFRAMLLSSPAEGYAAACEALARWDNRAQVREIEAPTLVVAGAEDPVVPAADAALLAEGIPRARLVVLPEAAHLANVEQADAFASVVNEHLALQEAA